LAALAAISLYTYLLEKLTGKFLRLFGALISNMLTGLLCGVMVSILATGPNGRGFKPGRCDGFLRAIKIRSTLSFGWEVKPEVPFRNILRHFKNPLRYFRY
jgi:hypothetical protein